MQVCESGKTCPQKFDFTIGCDPEFALASGASARASIARSRYWSREHNERGAECGLDGFPRIFELRPKPADCPHKLIDNIAKAFETQAGYFRRSRSTFIAAPYKRYACGGHIHFGVDDEYAEKLCLYLDNMLIPNLKRVYSESGWRNRERTGYGRSGQNWRSQPWGFEYRTPPTFLAEKPLALAVISLAGAVVEFALATKMAQAVWPENGINLEEFPRHPAFAGRWCEISYLLWLHKHNRVIREDKDLRTVWLP